MLESFTVVFREALVNGNILQGKKQCPLRHSAIARNFFAIEATCILEVRSRGELLRYAEAVNS